MYINHQHRLLILIAMLLFCFQSCEKADTNAKSTQEMFTHPDWSKDANIYEVNVRQYTEEGTFKAFQEHLPRLEKMGVEILWLMPIHPIGEKKRKGKLGSYYAVQDYKGVNPEFGTMDDLKALVKDAHSRGMKVILDWVANHTAWDHHWTEEHPEWYAKNEAGEFRPPVEDWSDVIQLDFENQAMRDAMADAMTFWVKEADIDGYRCDVAGMVPVDFWVRVRKDLDEIKPVFMLAEANEPELHQAFNMTYAWDFHFLLNDVAAGDMAVKAIEQQMEVENKKYGENDYRLMFTSNHDENSWKGTVKERLGDNVQTFAVLAATIHGMPLIYSGQEAGLDKRLAFFEKDVISWDELPLEQFYTTLNTLKNENEALWNGKFGGDYTSLIADSGQRMLAYKRTKGDDEVLVVLNFGDQARSVRLQMDSEQKYTDVFTGETKTVGNEPLELEAHGYLVLQK